MKDKGNKNKVTKPAGKLPSEKRADRESRSIAELQKQYRELAERLTTIEQRFEELVKLFVNDGL